MTESKIAVILGYLFLASGILGFIPGITLNSYLLGIFHVNGMNNIIYLITGVVLLTAGKNSECSAMRAMRVFGVVYGLMALFGILMFRSPMLGPIASNVPDTLFHAAVAVVTLYYGFLSDLRRTIQCPV